MPVTTYLVLLLSVLAAAGATIALVWGMGISLAWIGLAAIALAFLVHKVKR